MPIAIGMKRRPASVSVAGIKRQRLASDPTSATKPKITDAGTAIAAVVAEIPAGSTRTKMEVFRLALMKLGRGDEAIGTGTRTVLGAHLKQLAIARGEGWHRVVSSDGKFIEDRVSEQLHSLRAEGARPASGELLAAWAARVGADQVGCYLPKGGVRHCAKASDADVERFNPCAVEPLRGRTDLERRRELSGGKLFWRRGERKPDVPPFRVDSARAACQPSSLRESMARLEKVIAGIDLHTLHRTGAFQLKGAVASHDCATLLKFAQNGAFTDITHLDGEAGRCGFYAFCKQPPTFVEALRKVLYQRLVHLSPHLGVEYGTSLENLEASCRKAGQQRSAVIFLAYGKGGLNLAHQDPYGSVFFPYQAMLMLSRRGKDFTGGAFFVKNTSTGKATEVQADEGDITLFAANKKAAGGGDFKHGVRPVGQGTSPTCERFSVGIVFNLRK